MDRDYDKDVVKAVDYAEHQRHGGPGNMSWLILQALRWMGGVIFGINGKVDALLARPVASGNGECNVANIDQVLAAVAAIQGDTVNVERVLGELNAQIAALTQQVADLAAQVAAGSGVTAAELQSVVDALGVADATLDTLAPDPVVVVVEPIP